MYIIPKKVSAILTNGLLFLRNSSKKKMRNGKMKTKRHKKLNNFSEEDQAIMKGLIPKRMPGIF